MSAPTPNGPPPPPGVPPQMSPQDERMWAALCHISAFAGLLGGGFVTFVGPLVVWILKKDQSPLVDDQGKESVNFQITVLIYGLILPPPGVRLWDRDRAVDRAVRLLGRDDDHRLAEGEGGHCVPVSGDDPVHPIGDLRVRRPAQPALRALEEGADHA